jgi:hypothetical protein
MEINDLDIIAKWCIGDNIYSMSEILNYYNPLYLKIQILNNVAQILNCERLSNGQIEQRQLSIFTMIQTMLCKYKVKDCVINYCTHDSLNNNSAPVFTHSRLKGVVTRNILAPCFTFESYPEGSEIIQKPYYSTWKELVEINVDWKDKFDSCIFVGSITSANNRLHNTNVHIEPLKMIVADQPANSPNFIRRVDLSNYKYLLHLNGNNGAYASRFKYLLGTGSLVFYNYNSGNNTHFWEEWWMNDSYFRDGEHYIACKDKYEFIDKIVYYRENKEESIKISNSSKEYFKTMLSPLVQELFLSKLLNLYAESIEVNK